MRLYRHYKQKLYKHLFDARHSETREEVVVYECLYDSPGGKLWVRPKAMFHESIEADGRARPRFENVELRIDGTEALDASAVLSFLPVVHGVFGPLDPSPFLADLPSSPRFHLAVAIADGITVGFKLGYERDPEQFYSWMGGVLPAYRGVGVASALMNEQHQWCRKLGYKRVTTKTKNEFREMLVLNLRSGFTITGTETTEKSGLKILLEKRL